MAHHVPTEHAVVVEVQGSRGFGIPSKTYDVSESCKVAVKERV